MKTFTFALLACAVAAESYEADGTVTWSDWEQGKIDRCESFGNQWVHFEGTNSSRWGCDKDGYWVAKHQCRDDSSKTWDNTAKECVSGQWLCEDWDYSWACWEDECFCDYDEVGVQPQQCAADGKFWDTWKQVCNDEPALALIQTATDSNSNSAFMFAGGAAFGVISVIAAGAILSTYGKKQIADNEEALL